MSRSSSGVTMTTSPSSFAQSSTGRFDVIERGRFFVAAHQTSASSSPAFGGRLAQEQIIDHDEFRGFASVRDIF